MNAKGNLLLAALLVLIAGIVGLIVAKRQSPIVTTTDVVPATQTTITGGTFTAYLPSASTAGRTILLQLSSDAKRKAVFTQDYHNDKSPIVETGTWSQNGDTLLVNLDMRNGVANEPHVMTFAINNTTLALMDVDGVWGSEGLILIPSLLPLDSSWIWVETNLVNTEHKTPITAEVFVVDFSPEGTISAQTDCNTFTGVYHLFQKAHIDIQLLASTKKFCQDSYEDDFVTDINTVTSYDVDGDSLRMALSDDRGTMVFTQMDH